MEHTRGDNIRSKEDDEIVNFLSINPGHSHEIAAQAEMMRRLKNSIKKLDESLREDLAEYSTEMKNENKITHNLTRVLIFFTAVLIGIAAIQLLLLQRQINLTEEMSISERISQKRAVQAAIEFCEENKGSEESGLFQISTGEPASCEEVLEGYKGDDLLWSKIKNLF